MWHYKNNFIFDGKSNFLSTAYKLEFTISEFAKNRTIEEMLIGSSQNLLGPKVWQSSPERWIKIIVDVRLLDSHTSLAMMVRDHHGKILLLITKLTERSIPYLA